MIGNDIVDVAYAALHHNWRRPGYLAKVFTTDERARVVASATPDRLVWTLWSAKESAYKVSVQQGCSRKYAPKQWKTELVGVEGDATAYRVNYRDFMYHVRVEAGRGWIHSIARPWGLQSDKVHVCQMVVPKELCRQRGELKQALYRECAAWRGGESELYHVQKNAAAVPSLIYNGAHLNIPLSLSHHGRFGAYAYVAQPKIELATQVTS